MPRKYVSTERFSKPDPRYNSRLVAKFINTVMYQGKKSVAMSMVYETIEQ
ncbi:MAG: 30S ribosomal protein S7, partial [Planctomycetaceae bacterium]|nr:30S ribosomal protein S7 [Planctomycetaceae bacterium]